jgi:hypothetical protein
MSMDQYLARHLRQVSKAGDVTGALNLPANGLAVGPLSSSYPVAT